MVGAMIPAFEQRPKRFDVVHMNVAPDILFLGMVDRFVAVKSLFEVMVCVVIVRHNDRVTGDVFPHNALQGFLIGVFDRLSNHFSLAFYHAKDNRFLFSTKPSLAAMRLTPYIGLICLYNAIEGFIELAGTNGIADSMEHEPRGF